MPVRKIGLFVEGQSELIFLRNIIFHLFDPAVISFECLHLRSGSSHQVPYSYTNENAQLHFFILNIENDEKVLSYIKENEENYFSKGYEKLIGLRDLYSEKYHQLSGGQIDPIVSNRITNSSNQVVDSMTHRDSISFFFSIMEIESWWLSMPGIFPRIDPALTVESINDQLGVHLNEDNVEDIVYKPSAFLNRVMGIINGSYSKKYDEVESITSKITKYDIDSCADSRCQSFSLFHQEITGLI